MEFVKQYGGWIALGVVGILILGILGYQEMNGRVEEARQDATRWEYETMVAREEASRVNQELALANEAVASWAGEAQAAQSEADRWEREAISAQRELGQAEARVAQLEASARSTARSSSSASSRSTGGVNEIMRLAQGLSNTRVIDVIRSLLPLTGLGGLAVQTILALLFGS